MIRVHDFNTQWWGGPAGIVEDGAFFSLAQSLQQEALAPFCWAEFRSRFKTAPPLIDIHRAGFFLADTQQEFRIALKTRPPSPSDLPLQVRFADEQHFELCDSDFASFEQERYRHLPGCTEEKVNARYGGWARSLIREHPQTCLEVLADGVAQFWFLSRPDQSGLNLTLAMLRREAKVSGFLLYETALAAYALRGHRIGFASFSVVNAAVHNIYAKLGAHFLTPTGIWLWVP